MYNIKNTFTHFFIFFVIVLKCIILLIWIYYNVCIIITKGNTCLYLYFLNLFLNVIIIWLKKKLCVYIILTTHINKLFKLLENTLIYFRYYIRIKDVFKVMMPHGKLIRCCLYYLPHSFTKGTTDNYIDKNC